MYWAKVKVLAVRVGKSWIGTVFHWSRIIALSDLTELVYTPSPHPELTACHQAVEEVCVLWNGQMGVGAIVRHSFICE
jgi:hypothetical protein